MVKSTRQKGENSLFHQQNSDDARQAGGLGCLIRLAWMLIGTIALMFSLRGVWISRHSGITWHDYIFWLVIVMMVALRYVDITWMGGQTVKGDPATRAHWRRFALILLLGGLVLWLVVHALTRLLP